MIREVVICPRNGPCEDADADREDHERQEFDTAHFKNPSALNHCSRTASAIEAFERAFALEALTRASAIDDLIFIDS